MLDDFFFRALVAGIGLAIVVGPLGCFVVWRRMAYFGDTMAHSALLGVVLSFMFEFSLVMGVFGISLLISAVLLLLQKNKALPTDSLLGILSHSALALGLVLISLMTWLRIDITAFLFGDILSVTTSDIALIYAGGAGVLLVLYRIWRPLLAASVNEDLAAVEGLKPDQHKIIFLALMALVVAISIKLVGVLLITSLLIIPAATARRFSTTPEMMALVASIMGIFAVIAGLYGSLHYDTPSGPSIVVACLVLFIVSLLSSRKGRRS